MAIRAGLLAAAVAITVSAQAPREQLAQANAALQAGEADRSLALLSALPQSGASHNLRCRVLFTLESWDAAASECEQAVSLDGQNSDYHMWLGRALGEKADRAPFWRAYSLGKTVRIEFEEAVRLNPRNAEALADLGEYYYDAPGVVGGGIDKAEGVAVQLDRLDATRAHELRARITEERKDYGAAEREFKQAVNVSEHPAFQWMGLASFYRRHQRWTEMESAVQSGVKAAQRDRHAGVALFNGASVLSQAGKNLELAANMMEDYLAGSSKTEEAPAFVAYTRLARLKAQLGNMDAARQERAAALELAHDYRPAQDLKF